MNGHQTKSGSSIAAVIFDWAGTTVDHGSLAPFEAIKKVFQNHDIELSAGQIRQDMGLHKRDHIGRILEIPEVGQLWKAAKVTSPSAGDAEVLFNQLLPIQAEMISKFSKVIDGVSRIAERLRARGIKIGSTTGYPPSLMTPLREAASNQGYKPDCLVCPEDVGAGRPYPWMIYKCAIDLKIYPLRNCVKVGDTVSDIEEGRNAGVWTVGITRTGNLVGLSEDEWNSTGAAERASLLQAAKSTLEEAGADYVIESVAELEPVLADIEQRLKFESAAEHDLPGTPERTRRGDNAIRAGHRNV